MSPRRPAGRLRPRVWVAAASMRARGCLRLSSPRTVSAVAERSLSPGTGDPVGALVVRLLEAPHRSGRQRAVSPIDGPRRESRLGQTTLDRSHPLRPVGLEVSSSRSQRSAGKRPSSVRSDDAVDRKPASLLKAANRGSRQRAVSPINRAGRDPLLDEPALQRPHCRRAIPERVASSDRQHSDVRACCRCVCLYCWVCCSRCVASNVFRWPPAPRLASARCRWRSPPMPTERVTSFSSMCRDWSGGPLGPRPLNDQLGRAASQEKRAERYTARASPTPMPSADASSVAVRPPVSGTAPLLRTERSHRRRYPPTPQNR